MLFALALGAAAFEVEFQLGGEPVYLVESDVPQLESFFPAGMSELMGMVDRMQQQQRQQFRAPHNPCQEDQVRHGCRDAACLKAHLEQLAPACAMFLLKAQPSPSPVPAAMPAARGFFQHTFLGEDGKMHSESGRLSSAEGRKIEGEMQGMMDLVMSEFFGAEPPPQQQPRPRPTPAPRPSHPCASEVNLCKEELGQKDTGRGPILECLVAHYAQLGSDCKCFLHQQMGDELEAKVGPANKASAEPRVRAVPLSGREPHHRDPLFVLDDDDFSARPPPGHRLTCALFMMVFFMSVFLLLRRLCACCAPPKPRFAAVVPPQQPVKMTVEPLVIRKEETSSTKA